jgi:hypothetical protein
VENRAHDTQTSKLEWTILVLLILSPFPLSHVLQRA